MWFLFALITTLCWGTADLFYKKGSPEGEKYAHLKTAVTVGAVMGIHAIVMLCISGFDYDFRNLIIYLPVSSMYILSMTLGYFGLRWLELSVCSPIQNSSGALVCIMCLLFLGQTMNIPSAVGVVLICAGIFALGVLERRRESQYERENERKYKIGFTAFLMPVFYCIADALGTFFDAWYLDDAAASPLLGVTEDNLENVANISYELTFLIAAVVLFIYIRVIKKERICLPAEKSRAAAALFETGGQFAYVYAMSGNGIVAAPMIASYSIVSVLFSRIFLREKLTRAQYAVVAVVMAGILLLGISDGLAA